jgi:hypothetical protein
METVHQYADCSDPDMTSWSEQPDKSREFYTFFRIFFMFGHDDSIRQGEISKFLLARLITQTRNIFKICNVNNNYIAYQIKCIYFPGFNTAKILYNTKDVNYNI